MIDLTFVSFLFSIYVYIVYDSMKIKLHFYTSTEHKPISIIVDILDS